MTIQVRGVALLLVSLAVPSPGLAAEGWSPERVFRDITSGITRFITSALQARGAKLRALAAAGHHDEAARYWAAEKEFFAPRQQEYEDVLKTIASNLNEKYDQAITGPSSRLWKLASGAIPSTQWARIKEEREALRGIVKSYDEVELLRLEPFKSRAVTGAEKLLVEVDQKLQTGAAAAFSGYDHLAGKSFFAEYPVQLPASFFDSNLLALRPQLAKATPPQIARFVEVYAPLLGGREQALVASLYLEHDARAGARSMPRLLAALEAAEKIGLKVPAQTAVSVVNITPRQGAAGGMLLSITAPPHVAVEHVELEQLRQKLATREGLVIVLQTRDARIERRITDKSKVTSQMLSGTGNAAAQAKTAYASYSFELAKTHVTKRANVRVSVIDLRQLTLVQATYPLSQERQFTVASGIKREDPDYYSLSQHYQTLGAVEEFERSAPSVSLTEVVQSLNSTSASERAFASLEQIYAALSPPLPATVQKTPAPKKRPIKPRAARAKTSPAPTR